MAYIRGEAREQTTMFPVTLDELIPADHICRVIEAFVDRLDVAGKWAMKMRGGRKRRCANPCRREPVSRQLLTVRASLYQA